MFPLFLKVVWFGSHAVSNGQGYRQLRVSVNQPSSLHGQIVRLFPTLSPVAAAMILSLHNGAHLGYLSPSHCACSDTNGVRHKAQRQIRFQSWRKATKASFLKTSPFI